MARAKNYGKVKAWLETNHRRYKTLAKLVAACQEKTGVAESVVYTQIRRLRKRGVKLPAAATPQYKKPAKVKAKKGGGRSLTEFKEAYSKDHIVPTRIRAGLKELGDAWEYEMEFCRRCEVGIADMGNYRQLEEFAPHWYQIRRDSKRVWSGNPETIEAIKEMVK